MDSKRTDEADNHRGFMHLAAGLSVGLTGLAAGYAIGVVGDTVRFFLSGQTGAAADFIREYDLTCCNHEFLSVWSSFSFSERFWGSTGM